VGNDGKGAAAAGFKGVGHGIFSGQGALGIALAALQHGKLLERMILKGRSMSAAGR